MLKLLQTYQLWLCVERLVPATAPHALPRGRRGRTARGRRGATSRRRRRRTRLGGFSSRRGCCCCRRIVRFLFLLRRLLRLLLLVRVGRHESGTGPPRSWFASFFFALRPTVQAKGAIRAGKGLFVYGAKTTDCLASPPSSERLLLSASSVTSVSFEGTKLAIGKL